MRRLLVADGVVGLPGARAVLCDADRIAWVGDPAAAPAADVREDLDGAWIAPGFVDAHVHATATGLGLSGADLRTAPSAEEALERIRGAAPAAGDVVIATGWDESSWPEGAPPSADALGEAAGGRRVLAIRVDGHACAVDATTLAECRDDLESLDGVIRDAAGRPTGWLVEGASAHAQARLRTMLSDRQLTEARAAFCEHALARGVVSVHEMGIPALSDLADARAWATGSWPLEVLVWWADLDARVALDAGLRPGGDLFLDGSIGSSTAAMSEPYSGGGCGQLFCSDADVEALFDHATVAGVGAGVHAIGDVAITQALDALERVASRRGAAAVRAAHHRLEHCELIDREGCARMAALGVVASMQPAFDAAWGGRGRLYEARLGAARALRLNPVGWLAEAGTELAFSSDSPVTPVDPWAGVVAAEEHRGGHHIDRALAFRAATTGGRRAAGQEVAPGVVVGGRADLAVWDGDPFGVPDPRRLRCVATMVGGQIVHGQSAPSGA